MSTPTSRRPPPHLAPRDDPEYGMRQAARPDTMQCNTLGAVLQFFEASRDLELTDIRNDNLRAKKRRHRQGRLCSPQAIRPPNRGPR